MQATAELFDAWADLLHGSICLGCGMPGRPWCRSCARMLERGVEPRALDPVTPDVVTACAGEYDGWLRELILAHKEHSAWSLAAPLGVLLAHAVHSVAARAGWLSETCGVALVPIPSHRRVVRHRGHDPALRMTRAAAVVLRSWGLEAHAVPLLRLRLPVKDSVGLRASQRGRNLEDAFAVTPRGRRAVGRIGMARILVCDDVTTTGTTLREACTALQLAGLPASGAATLAAVRPSNHSSQVNT